MSLDLVAASCLHFDQDAAGTAALVLFDAEAGYKLLVRNSDDQPRTVTVQLQYAKSFSKSPRWMDTKS